MHRLKDACLVNNEFGPGSYNASARHHNRSTRVDTSAVCGDLHCGRPIPVVKLLCTTGLFRSCVEVDLTPNWSTLSGCMHRTTHESSHSSALPGTLL